MPKGSKPRRSVSRWYRRHVYGHRKKTGFTLPLLVVAGIIPGAVNVYRARNAGLSGMTEVASRNYLGYDTASGAWSWSNLRYGTLPIIMGVLGHMLASKLGINRALGRAGIPVFRL